MKTQTDNQQVGSCPVPRWLMIKATLDNLPFDDFIDRALSDPDAQILDVRTKEEFATGSLKGAINIDYMSRTLADELEALPRDRTYYVFCRTSRRSIRICVILRNAGFEHVYNLDDGLQDHWIP